jgi:S1-C subfamily serine protease
VNAASEVVGITTAVIRGVAEGVGFATSIDTAKPIAAELVEKGRAERGFPDVSPVEITPSLTETFDLPVERGLAIQRVQAGGPADRAGETVSIEFYRSGQRQTLETTLG